MSGAVTELRRVHRVQRDAPGDTLADAGNVRKARRSPGSSPAARTCPSTTIALAKPRVPDSIRLASGPRTGRRWRRTRRRHVLARHRRLHRRQRVMRFPGSNKESTLRKHAPVRISKGRMDEESSHAPRRRCRPRTKAGANGGDWPGISRFTTSGWCTDRDRTTGGLEAGVRAGV